MMGTETAAPETSVIFKKIHMADSPKRWYPHVELANY
jgi:hypothetical protein